MGNASTPVVLLHDAAIDEYMATVLLTTMKEVELLAIIVVNGDCITTPAMNAAWRIQQYIGRTDIPLGLSAARGYNPFPWEYRGDCIKQNDISALQNYDPATLPYRDGDRMLRRVLRQATEPVTILCTGPLTPLAMLMDSRGGRQLMEKIARVVWMGGAIHVGGNLDPATLPADVVNPYAEWNVFWDPYSADRVFKGTHFPITLFPLDITNTAAISTDFMNSLLSQGKQYPTSFLAYQSYEIVAAESFYDMWDVCATAWLARPQLYETPTTMELEVVTDDNGRQGALVQRSGGRAVDVVLSFADLDGFYSYVLQQFKS